jgi:hypothetical protein
MKQDGFPGKTRSADEVNRHNREERARLSGGMFGSKLLPQPAGYVPYLSPASPGASHTQRKRVIDR